jgi:hypothetical protein
MAWKDVTGYSRGEAARGVEPRSWELRFGGLRVVLTQHIAEAGVWFTHCEPFYDLHPIGKVGEDVEALKKAAVQKAVDSLKGHSDALISIANSAL